jgi:hypothetical protein
MKRILPWILVFLLPAVLVPAQEIKLPVFYLRYDGGTQFEQLEDEEESVLDYQRHRFTFRIKEQWSDDFTTNLYAAIFYKLYDDPLDNYWYCYVNPNYIWDITDRLRWSSAFRSKWTVYKEPDSDGNSKDLTSLRVKTELTYRVLEQLKIIPSLQGVFDLFDYSPKDQHIYTAGLRFESRIGAQVRMNGRYRLILPAAPDSERRFSVTDIEHEFGVNVSWDPNKRNR